MTPTKVEETKIKPSNEGSLSKLSPDSVKSEEKQEISFFTPELLKKITEEMPNISTKQIFGHSSRAEIAADQILFHLGKALGGFQNERQMHIAFNLLRITIHISAFTEIISEDLILHNFFSKNQNHKYEELEKMSVREVLSGLIGLGAYSPLQKTHNGLVVTHIGMLAFEYFQKIKAELLVLQQNETLKPLFEVFLQFRNLMNFEGQNLEIDWIYSAIINLRKLIQKLDESGEIIFKDKSVYEKIKKIHTLLQEMQNYQEMHRTSKKYTIQDHTRFGKEIMNAIQWLISFFTQDFKYKTYQTQKIVSESPFPEMGRYLVNNWNEFEWESIYFQNENAFYPFKIMMPVSDIVVERSILKYLLSSKKENLVDLPVGPPPAMIEKDITEMAVQEEEHLSIRADLLAQLPAFIGKTDFDLGKHKDLMFMLIRLTVVHELCFLKHYETGEQIHLVTDKKYHTQEYTARSIKLNKKLEEK